MRAILIAATAAALLLVGEAASAGTCSTGEYGSCARCCETNPNIKNSSSQCKAECKDYAPKGLKKASGGSCSSENAKCNAFCRTPAGVAQGQACLSACATRQAKCLETGTYFWRNKATVGNLERK